MYIFWDKTIKTHICGPLRPQVTRNEKIHILKDVDFFVSGASDEARTRYLHLGKVALYQMSYTRIDKRYHITPVRV